MGIKVNMTKERHIKIRIKNKYKKLIIKLDKQPNEEYSIKDIIVALSKPYSVYTMNGENESLNLFISCLKDKNIDREKLVSAFNKHCKIEPWFKYNHEPDGGEWIDEKEPLLGFAIKIKSTKKA